MINDEQLIDLYLAAVEGADEPHRASARAIGRLADFYGVRAADIMRCIEEAGVEPPPLDEPTDKSIKMDEGDIQMDEGDIQMDKVKWTPEMDADVDRMRAEGEKWDVIGEKYGKSGSAASMRWYKRHRPQINKEFDDAVNAMVAESAGEMVSSEDRASDVPLPDTDEPCADVPCVEAPRTDALMDVLEEARRLARSAGIFVTEISAATGGTRLRAEASGADGGVSIWRQR